MIKNATIKPKSEMTTKTLLNYQGNVEHETINSLLNQANAEMQKIGIDKKLQKRTFYIIAEFLENIQKHAAFMHGESLSDSLTKPRFTFEKRSNELLLTTGNIIYNKSIKTFQEKLDRLNRLDANSLRRLHSFCIANGELSDKGGAGLGFIEVVLKSRNKISYNFKPLDDKISYCILQVRISNQ